MPNLEEQFSSVTAGDVGIFGDPVAHSLSPIMHTSAFNTWWGAFRDRDEPTPRYHKFHVAPAELEAAFALAKQRRLRGFNVTVPHKVAAVAHLDWTENLATRVGAINTVALVDGTFKGFNTDGDGFRRALTRDLEFDPEGRSVLLLGAGGTARVIAAVLLQHGITDLRIWNRNADRLNDLLATFADGAPVAGVADKDIPAASRRADLIINATSVGLKDSDGVPVAGLAFRAEQTVFDVIYHRKTDLLREAERAGARVSDGLGMLVYQGGRSFEIWTGSPAPYELMRAAILESFKGR